MGTRGRKSAADLAITSTGTIETIDRADAPYDLTDEQSAEWWAVVNRMPADWFPRETHAILGQYCRHVVAARRVAQLVGAIEGQESLDIEEYDRLLKMQEREGRAMTSIATKLRITQQATHGRSKKKSQAAHAPWER